MRYIDSGFAVIDNTYIGGGRMTSGPHKGEEFRGSVIIDMTFRSHYIDVPDTLWFTQNPKRFDKFGDCTHYKISGSVYFPSNNGPLAPSSRKSVFGLTYDQAGVGSYILTRSAEGTQHHVVLPGDYNNCLYGEEGRWAFAIGAIRKGNKVFVAYGYPDLIGGSRYRGTYSVCLREYHEEGGAVRYRTAYANQYDLWIRTNQSTPLEVVSAFNNILEERISTAKWQSVPSSEIHDLAICQKLRFDQYSPNNFFHDMNVNWGEMASDAYGSVPLFKGNGIAYAKDVLELRKSAHGTLQNIKALGSAGKLASKAANIFLSFYYGWRLFVSDTGELVNAQRKQTDLKFNICKATSQRTWSAHGASYLATFHCYYERFSRVSGLDRFILENDLALTPENLWDLIPYSFVVDWFTGIGDVLEDMTNYYNMVQTHHVICSGRSIKATRQIPAQSFSHTLAGNLTVTYYDRWYSEGALNPTFQFSNSVNPLDHLIEGSALIVSRR